MRSDDLKKRLDNLWAMLEEEGYYVKANTVVLAKNRIEELEAKLARAVDFIEDLEGHEWPLDVQAKRVIKELKGQGDEYADKWED